MSERLLGAGEVLGGVFDVFSIVSLTINELNVEKQNEETRKEYGDRMYYKFLDGHIELLTPETRRKYGPPPGMDPAVFKAMDDFGNFRA